ncbi:MAG: META domain-containing protein [Acidimicrobiia bacterium]
MRLAKVVTSTNLYPKRGFRRAGALCMLVAVRCISGFIAFVVVLSITSCGGDDEASAPNAAVLRGQTFKSTSVEGHDMVAGTDVTFAFDGDGVSVNAGCNTLLGQLEIVDGALSVGTMAQTMMGCTDDLMEQDQLLVSFLEAGPAISLADNTLTLAGADITITADAIS